MPKVVIGNCGNVFNIGQVGTINYGREIQAEDAQEASNPVKNVNACPTLLDQVRHDALPQRNQSLASIRAFAESLAALQVKQNALLPNYATVISGALTDFCNEASDSKSWFITKELTKLTEGDVHGSTEQTLNKIIATAKAAKLVEQVIEEIKKPDMSLDLIKQKLKLIEEKAAELDDPKTIARRKLARRLLVAGGVLGVLAVAAVVSALLVLGMVIAPFVIPLFIGLIVSAVAMLASMSVTVGISTAMPKQFSYQHTALSCSLHFFRDVVKDSLAGRSFPGGIPNNFHQICRNAR